MKKEKKRKKVLIQTIPQMKMRMKLKMKLIHPIQIIIQKSPLLMNHKLLQKMKINFF